MATTTSHFELLIEEVFNTIKAVGDKLHGRLAVLEQQSLAERIKALEQRPALIYRGVWEPGVYVAGSIVTQGGSAWIAKTVTSSKPGDPALESRAWTLMVKRGADGKDLRS